MISDKSCNGLVREHIIEAKEIVSRKATPELKSEGRVNINTVLEAEGSWVIQTEATACVKGFVVFEEVEEYQQDCGAENKGWSGRYGEDQIM